MEMLKQGAAGVLDQVGAFGAQEVGGIGLAVQAGVLFCRHGRSLVEGPLDRLRAEDDPRQSMDSVRSPQGWAWR
ncbi:hypothetical protein GCM10023088_30530 [Actinomadura verrucosospora]